MRDHAALTAYIDARARIPFTWGRAGNDCGSFAAGAVRAQTGADPLAAFAHRWTSRRGARRALAAEGGLAATVDHLLTRISPAMAQRGDIAEVEHPDGPGLMVVEGDTLVGPGPSGARRLPRAAMTRAWSADQGPSR